MNDDLFSHLHAPYRAYALLSASERIQWIRQDRWIHYSRAEQVLNRLSDLLTYPARDRMPCLLLFGPTGMGKTRIVQKFLREHRSGFDDVTGRTRLPVVAVQMPPGPSGATCMKNCWLAWVLFCHSLRFKSRATAGQNEPALLQIKERFSQIPLKTVSDWWAAAPFPYTRCARLKRTLGCSV